MTSQLAQQENILYQDDTVQIYRDKITILAYYFPIPAAKNIDMIDVEAVHLKDNVDGQAWGTSPGHMDTWFALDNNRHLKKQYIEIVVKDSDVKAAFSPNDPKKVMAIIETNSALLKAQKNLNQKNEELREFKEQAKYTSQVPQRQIQQKIELIVEEPELKEPRYRESDFREPVFIPNVEPIVPAPQRQTKGLGESIKEKFNEKIEGLKNVKDTLKQKYQEGKENAYVSPDNKIDVAKYNIKTQTGQAYKQAGQALQQKGNQLQYNA